MTVEAPEAPVQTSSPQKTGPSRFMTAFAPGLILGVVIGLFGGAFLVPLLQASFEQGPTMPLKSSSTRNAPINPSDERLPGNALPEGGAAPATGEGTTPAGEAPKVPATPEKPETTPPVQP
ncbi:MAG: hypothetical protein IBJ18_01740 [Phycisphaerales bacterium]|nr:hypothetical protein [Phycisphaerales bacterium]